MTERLPLAYLFPLRILFGVILVIEGWGKLQGDWLHGTPLATSLGNWLAAEKPYGFFLPVVRSAFAPPKIFGALMLFCFVLGNGQGLAPPGNALIMGAVCVLFVFAPPGRFLGVDMWLRDRLPRWMI